MSFRLYLCLALALFTDAALASVLAIDYGSESIKVSLMKPGVPFDVVLNRDSKRKITSTVGWKGDERLFGADGFSIATRYPADAFHSLKLVQGVTKDSPGSSFHATLFPYLNVIETPRHTHAFQRPNGIEYTTEELIGMQFSYVKKLAEDLASGEKVTDAVVTVPAYYSQFERQAVLDSVAIAGMRPLTLINDGTAIAVNYAMTRTFAAPEHHVIYDAGAGGVRATVVTFTTVSPNSASSSSASASSTDASASGTSSSSSAKSTPSKAAKKNKKPTVKADVTHIEVKGFGYDRKSSGLAMDARLRDIIVAGYEKSKGGQSLKGQNRALAKLWKDITKIKAVLSINTESRVSIESFIEDNDLRSKVTREEFEKACEDLKPGFTQPIFDALKNAGLTLNDISSVIITGGGSRTPMVQAALKQAVGESKIAQNVNADEAAVLGAAFYGASLSPQFKTKEIKVADQLADYGIQVSYASESNPTRMINTLIFPAQAKLGAKKTLTLKRKDDFVLNVSYKGAPADVPTDILEAKILGITEAVANLTSRGAVEPVIKLTVSLNEAGIANILEAQVTGEVKPDESLADKIKGFFGAGSSSSSTTETATADAAATPSDSQEKKEAEPTEAPAAKWIPTSIPLKIQFTSLSIVPLTSEEKAKSLGKLVALDKAENARARKEEARNHLEGYLYRLRDLLDGEETSPFIEFSKESERKTLRDTMEATQEWMAENSETAETAEFWDKRSAMEALEKPVQFRYTEAETAPQAYQDMTQAMLAGRMFLNSARENATADATEGLPEKYTKEELDAVETKLIDDEKWLNEMTEIQKKHMKYDDPVLLTAEMKARGMTLQNQVMKLLKRKAPKPTPKPTETATATADASEAKETTEPVVKSGEEGGQVPLQEPVTTEEKPRIKEEL